MINETEDIAIDQVGGPFQIDLFPLMPSSNYIST